MEQCRSRRAVRGFTLMETLVTVLIIICLLAVSMVAVVTYRDYLKISELDNAAREIYMAAQNRAVLLDGRGSLERLTVKQNGSNELKDVEVSVGDGESVSMTFYYISSEDGAVGQLLPDETIESSLWNGRFYVVYEPESASVTDVFYAEKPFVDEKNFEQFYRKYKGTSKRERMKLSPMTGYYGGDSAQGGSTIALRTPVIRIYNEDELKAEVTWWVPRSLSAELDKINLAMTLRYQGNEIKLDEATLGDQYSARVTDGMAESGVLYLTYRRTYLLDSLETGKQFKDIPGISEALGDNFELTAEVSYTGTTQKVNGAKKTVENNSLFAYDEENGDPSVAYIEYLRHLQNLRAAHSKVQGKTQAVQIADIDASHGGEGYKFLPVNNPELVSYTVQKKSPTANEKFVIRDLRVETDEQYAGLFGDLSAQPVPGDASAASFTADGVRLVNASVSTTSSDGYAGALAGQAGNALFRDCRVYWEIGEQGQTNLQYLLGNNVSGYKYQEKGICGKYAGGLAGRLVSSGVVNSFASTLVSGMSAGGLAGAADTLALERSYADCYIEGGSTAGLAGTVTGSNRITDCYSAGFLAGTQKEGGLCLGDGTVAVQGSYSAMLYSTRTDLDYSKHYPLCENGNYDEYTHYLFTTYVDEKWNEEYAVSHQNLTSALFEADSPFGYVTVSGSHPYNLQTGMSLSRYPYPAFPDMGHYGDWSAEFSEGSLVYWEQYAPAQGSAGDTEGEYRFEGANLNLLKDEPPVGDGYAVVLEAKKDQEQKAVTITYTYQTADGEKTEDVFYSLDGRPAPDDSEMAHAKLQPVRDEGKDRMYYLALLPEEIVCSGYASADFYQKLSFEIIGTEQVTGTYYYSPHFAATMIEYDANVSASSLAKNRTVRVRTPRHLYELSRHREYYASSSGLVFQQELDLDYEKYTAYMSKDGLGLYRTKDGAVQGAIGKNAALPFRCFYNGGCHVISNVTVNEDGSYIGLFGYNMGTIRDTVYLSTVDQNRIMKKNVTGHRTIYIGGLVGYNNGTVNNCAVADMALQIYAYDYSTVYAGGLVGINYGAVRGSSAALKYIAAEANYSNAYLGGFIGKNAPGGTIRDCYAVGRVAAARSRYGKVLAAGFAGGNQSVIRNSYAATALTVSGEATAYGFCADNTGSSNFYLNGGTYRYDGREYALQYEDGGTTTAKAQPQTYTPMTAGEGEEDSVAKRMGFASGAPKYGAASEDVRFPYPAVVLDAQDHVIHYGQWPEMLTLGRVGVCYWEKEVTQVGQSTNKAYHFSAIIVDPVTDSSVPMVERVSTLCTEHNDGGVIKEYGYGYLYDGEAPVLSVTNTENAGDSDLNEDVSRALEAQTEGRYKFAVFTTRQEDDGKDTGLYLKGMEPYGTWTLSQGDGSRYQFYVNPFFGDALAYLASDREVTVAPGVPRERPGDTASVPYEVRSVRQLMYINWNYKEKNISTILTYNTSTKKGTRDQFPYLSYYKSDPKVVDDFWEQTHDLNGANKMYSPIAEFFDPAGGDIKDPGRLWGWFGGTYDGADYVIENVSIEGGASSCAGLFGIVYNGTLKNIIMYSSDSSAVITCRELTQSEKASASCWYAMGTLAGLAASDTGSAVVNCSVAGYRILDRHYTNGGAWGGSGIGGLLGISNMQLSGCSANTEIEIKAIDNDNMRIGGLVGTCQQSIRDCYSGGKILFDGVINNNERFAYIGGIVGGIYMRRLTVGDSTVKIGGDGTVAGKPLTNALYNCYSYVVLPKHKNKINALYAIGGEGDIYPGTTTQDKGLTTYSNCYYLRDTVLSENGGTVPTRLTDMEGKKEEEVKALTYEEMSDGTLLEKLNNGGAHFSTVTVKTEDDNKIDGKYSFATSQALTGLNYPFPTILTQANTSYSSGKVNVHYGDWPLSGIERENGSLPINIDLFADYAETMTETDVSGEAAGTGAAQKQEKVWLSKLAQLAGKGTYRVSCANAENEEDASGAGTGSTEGSGAGTDSGTGDGGTGTGGATEGDGGTVTEPEPELPVAEAFFRTADGSLVSEWMTESEAEEVPLVVTGLREGIAQVTVTYEPATAGMVQVTPLTITVNVTAELQLKPGLESGQIVPDETPGDVSGEAESGSQSEDGGVQAAGSQISMLSETTVFTNERSDIDLYSFDSNGNALPDSLKQQITLNVTGVSSVEDAYLSEAVAANAFGEDGVTPLPCRGLLSITSRALVGHTSLIVEYEYTYKDKTYQSSSTVNVAVKELVASAEPVELYLDEEAGRTLKYERDGFSFRMNGKLVDGIQPEIETIFQGNQAVAVAEQNEDGTLQITAGTTASTTTITLSLRFEYEGSSHVVTTYLNVSVYESRVEVTSAAMTDGIIYLYPGSANDVMAEVTARLNERGKSATFAWELSEDLQNYAAAGGAASYPASAESAEPQTASSSAPEPLVQSIEPEPAAQSEETQPAAGVPEDSVQSPGEAELQIEEAQAVLHQSADGLPEEELIVEAEEVILPEDGTVSIDAGTGNADAGDYSAADAGTGIADGTVSADYIIEEMADGAMEVESFYSPQPAENSDGEYSTGGVMLALTDAAKDLDQPVTGTLTVKVTVTAADQTTRELSRTVEVRIMPNVNSKKQTAFLAAEDVNNVLYEQKLEYDKQKEERKKTLAEGEVIEPYTELEVQKTTLRAIEVTMPQGGVVPEDGVKEVESFWLAVLPRRAVSTVEDQLQKNPAMSDEEKEKLQNILLPEQAWKAELDSDTKNSWEKGWSDYQVTEAEAVIREKQDTREKYVEIMLTWSAYHEETARRVTYMTVLFPEDLIRVKPAVEIAESEQLESAGVDEYGVTYYELELDGEAEGGAAGELPDGSETGTEAGEQQPDGSETGAEAGEQQPDGSDEDPNIVDDGFADGTGADNETQPDVIIDSGTEGMQPGTEFFEDIGADPVISETGEGFIVQEIELQTHSNEPELSVEDAEILDF